MDYAANPVTYETDAPPPGEGVEEVVALGATIERLDQALTVLAERIAYVLRDVDPGVGSVVEMAEVMRSSPFAQESQRLRGYIERLDERVRFLSGRVDL